MSTALYTQLLSLACGCFLLAAVLVVWLRRLSVIVKVFAAQGVALAAAGIMLGTYESHLDLVAVAVGIGLLRAVLLPRLMRRALTASGQHNESTPLVNVAASLLAAAVLTLLAYAASQPLVQLDPTPATRALPVGLAVVLIGFFTLVTRKRAVAQMVGFLTLDNGITMAAFLATSGVPLIVELGVSLDLLLATLVLHLLTHRMRMAFGGTDIDDLRELRD